MDFGKVMGYFNQRPRLKNALVFANRCLPYLMAVLFFIGGGYLFFTGGLVSAFWYFLIPAVKFVLATVIRAAVNVPRPYDVLDYEPLVPVEHGKGKSTPSRHTACAFAIARAFLMISPWAFGAGVLLAIAVGTCRVLCGCHFPKDVFFAVLFII